MQIGEDFDIIVVLESHVFDAGYHIRKGGHSIEMYDWQRFLDFADYHLKKKK
ncbi:MAG: hypothetical protein RQ760_14740 [Sedimentisphaerales bacterium]|nr:hypothetical protein [Sedimentisphaerales bacterium]